MKKNVFLLSILLIFGFNVFSQQVFCFDKYIDSKTESIIVDKTTITFSNTESAEITLTNSTYDIKDSIVTIDTVSNSKIIYHTMYGDSFIKIAFNNNNIYQIKWVPHFGGILTFK